MDWWNEVQWEWSLFKETKFSERKSESLLLLCQLECHAFDVGAVKQGQVDVSNTATYNVAENADVSVGHIQRGVVSMTREVNSMLSWRMEFCA